MRKFVGLLIVVLIALAIAIGIRFLPGYVLLQIRQFSIAAPLWLAVLTIVIAILALWLVYFMIKHAWYLPSHIKRYVQKQQWQKTQRLLSEHLMQFLARDWSHAEKGFTKLAQRRYLVRSMYLFAAICAKHQGNDKQQLDYIHRANEHPKCQHDLLFQLVLVDQLLAEKKWQAAEDKLQPWLQHKHKHPQVLLRHLMICCRLQYWSKAQEILPILRKHKLLSESVQHQYQLDIYTGVLQQAAHQAQPNLEEAWLNMPKVFQVENTLLEVLLACAEQWEMAEFIQKQLEKALKSHWQDSIFVLYCQAEALPLQTRLTFSEKWIKEVAPSAENYYAMGQIYLQSQVLEQAAMFFHKSLELNEQVKTYHALAGVYLKQAKETQALLMFQQAEKLM